ncbi:hypothetical protein QZH41_008821 [Actinostola sp. cb2023]|nr:hypothetical protein QZH41_008821 [Actinostola sp. cb2023]
MMMMMMMLMTYKMMVVVVMWMMAVVQGWAMQNAMFIFLKRRWEHDEGYMQIVLDYFREVSYPVQLLLFPEGTNLDKLTKVKSDSFAKKNNLLPYEYVLHPRIRGFTFCVQNLQQGRLDAIHDVTVGYDVNRCFWEKDLILGNFPREMHFHLQRHPIKTLPEDEDGLGKWCCERWDEKEERLKKFYAVGQGFCPLEEIEPDDGTESTARNQLILALVFWFTFITGSSFAIYYSLIIRWYFYSMLVIYVAISTLGAGSDRLQLWSHNKFFKKTE